MDLKEISSYSEILINKFDKAHEKLVELLSDENPNARMDHISACNHAICMLINSIKFAPWAFGLIKIQLACGLESQLDRIFDIIELIDENSKHQTSFLIRVQVLVIDGETVTIFSELGRILELGMHHLK